MIIQFLEGVVDVALVVLLSLVWLTLRDIRDGIDTRIAQERLEYKRQRWVREEHDEH